MTGKTAGIDMVWRNYVTVILRVETAHNNNNNNNNRFMALCPGLPRWAGTRRNTHPHTIL